jgi:hypothetical protein
MLLILPVQAGEWESSAQDRATAQGLELVAKVLAAPARAAVAESACVSRLRRAMSADVDITRR